MLEAGRLGMLAALASLVPACSLLGLDRLGYVRCDENADCASLTVPPERDDGCNGWMCEQGYCRIRPLDFDDDGHAREGCGVGSGGDCDDRDPTRHRLAEEVCNGIDDDCDFALDEDVAPGTGDMHFVAVTPVPETARLVDTASVQDGVTVALVDAASRGLFEHVTSLAPFTSSAPLEPVLVPDVGAAPRSGRCALAASTTSIPIDDACTGDPDCTGGLVCRARADGRRVCGTFAGTCATDAECADESLCNGAERCVPGAPEADVRGCAAALVETACGAGEVCDERAATCHPTRPCDVVELAAAPVGGDRWVAASLSDHCAAGSLRISVIDPAGAALRTTGGVIRTTAFFAADPDADDCTGASRAGGPGASGLSIDSLGGPTPQALLAYRTAASGEADVEIVGAWLERDVMDETWVSLSDGGTPAVLPARAASGARPAVAAFETTAGGRGYLVAYPAAGGGVAIHAVPALPPPAADCPSGPPPSEVCLAGDRTLVPDAASVPRTTPPLEPPSSFTVGTDVVVGDVSLAVRTSTTADAVVALAYATTAEIVVRIGTLNDGALDFSAGTGPEHRVPFAGATDLSIAQLGAGLSLPNPIDVPEGGLVVTWRDTTATWVLRLRDGRAPTPPVPVGVPIEGPRATYLDESLVVVGRHAGDVVVVPLTCPVPTR